MKIRVAIASAALLAATCLTPPESHAGSDGAGVGLAIGLGLLGGIIANAQQQQYYQQQQQQFQQQQWLEQKYYRQQQIVGAWSQIDPRILDCIRNNYHFDPVISRNGPDDPQMSRQMIYCNSLVRSTPPPVGGDTIPPPPQPRHSFVSRQQQDVVPMARLGRNFTVNVTVNGAMTLPFLVDSGAEVVGIPINVFRGLQQRGTIQDNDIMGVGYMGNADGSELKTVKFIIRELQVGRHVAHDVQALLLPAGSDLLLGQTFLARFTWTLDARNQQLIITD